MEKSRFVTYTESDRDIVRSGITAICEVLMGTDSDRKRSMLFCLDWFMDPYYGQDISTIKDELVNLLQVIIITNNEMDVKEDAIQLLGDYAWGPFEILEREYERIEDRLKPDVDYIINMHRVNKIERIIINKCIEILSDIRSHFEGIPDRVWIIYNRNLTELDEERNADIEATWLIEDGKIHNTAVYLGSTFSRYNDDGFYINPEMHFNIFLKEKKIVVAYYMGKRMSRCLRYDLICEKDEYQIGNEQVIWVG